MLRPMPIEPIPPETVRVACAAFSQGNRYLRVADELDMLFTDEAFLALFPTHGQPAQPPWRLALVTILQFAEGLSDRQAVNAVRSRIDWKYALRLELTDPGFDASVLSEFRTRLITGEAESLLFDTLLTWCHEHQLIKARGRQRTDSTHILAAVRALNRLEVVGETLRHTFLLGSDSFGRDVYSRVLYGTRVSLLVGITSALLAAAFGVLCGLAAGYLRWLDGPLMRVMDGIMAIPAILIAIAVVALWRASLPTVIIAIAIPEIPRVTRLVRSLVLTIREEPYVEAAIALGTPTPKIMFGHILPNTVAPLLVQGTYICAFSILLEAILSFLGVGLPPDIPTWGNIMAEGRVQFVAYPHNVFFPGVFLALTVLAVNILGDGLRDTLDPKMAKRV